MMPNTEKILLDEFNDINDNPDLDLPYTISYWDPPGEENIFNWKVLFIGPEGTAYDGGFFRAKITFEKDYPKSPPSLYFKTKIFNCNINESNGRVCISIINDWKINDKEDKKYIEPERKNIKEVLFAASILFYDQNPDDAYNSKAAELYKKEDKTEFNNKVKEYIDLYATEEKYDKEELQNWETRRLKLFNI